jgi:hypothetical protein
MGTDCSGFTGTITVTGSTGPDDPHCETCGRRHSEHERADRLSELQTALERLHSERRLDCVVAGKTTNDGRPASVCTEIITRHQQMCAGCAARRLLGGGGS